MSEKITNQGGVCGSSYPHTPVFLERTLELLGPAISAVPAPIAVDGTLGMGGHAQALLERYEKLRIIGFDRDAQARSVAAQRLLPYGKRIRIIAKTYDKINETLAEEGICEVHGVLYDLGVSSLQIDTQERGFSYSKDAPLDMRMDVADELNAYGIVNGYSAVDLKNIFKKYGDEVFASRIAQAIVRRRASKPLETTFELVDVIRASIPARAQRGRGHPAKRVFQALRIEVNNELGLLQASIGQALAALAVSGRMVALTYHSLEERLIKQAFSSATSSRTPKNFPVELPELRPQFRVLAKREVPSDEEIARNSRSAAARLRAVERIRSAGNGAQ